MPLTQSPSGPATPALDEPRITTPRSESKPFMPLPQFSGRAVLLVEDNPASQRVALKMLECFGLRVRLASNGLEALDELERESCDLGVDGLPYAGNGWLRGHTDAT